MKKIITLGAIAMTLCATSCSTDENSTGFDDSGLSRIELGGAGNTPTSRAGFTEAATTLKLHYVSTLKAYDESTFPFNDGEGKGTLYMTSSATAAIDADGTTESVSAVSQTTGADGEKRYWDDIHGKNSVLALYSIAVPNKTTITKNATAFNAWDTKQKKGTETTIANTIAWTVSTAQTLATIADEDLAYSNNVSGSSCLGYDVTTKKFEKAEGTKSLVFKHALSRFTINVKKGDGFGDFSSEFNVTSMKLNGFTVAGTLDVAAGTITPTTTNATVDAVGSKADYTDGTNKLGYTFKAQVFPNTTVKDVTTTMLTIVVDGNNYNITGSEIFNSLKENNPSMDVSKISSLNPGTNYNLTIIVKKTGIVITSAKLVDWETINGTEMEPSNAIDLTAEMEKSAGTQTIIASDIYRSTSLTSGYTADGNKNTLSAANELSTKWYWPDNNTFYYFRTISPQGTSVTAGTNDNITMTGGAIADTNDFIWGAPLKEEHTGAEHKFDYSNGYDTYLYPAIGPTKSEIHITQFHMMSNLQVNLSTTDDGSAVDLTNAKVEILGFYNKATLALSNAKITTTGDKVTSQAMTASTDHKTHTWRVIPQSTTGITFKITADGNEYIINLPADTNIETWVPGKSYVYSFKLKKTAIEILSAKLVEWEEIKAADKTITLES